MMEKQGCCTDKTCKCPHHAMVPIFIILIALVFLLQAFDVVSDQFVAISWPILLGLIGLQKLCAKMCKCC